MDKFELLCLLEAISNYAYDIHYTANGRFFFSDHLFSERLSDVDVKDDFIETFYLGKSQEAPASADIARKVADLTPEITDNTQDNFKRLRNMIIRALMGIQAYDGTKGEEDLLGSVAHILQRHNGLLYRQLTYTPEEIRNDNDWRDIVDEEDTTQTLENEKWIMVHPNKENPDDYRRLKVEDGETSKEAVERKFGKDDKKADKDKKEPEKAEKYKIKDAANTKEAEQYAKNADLADSITYGKLDVEYANTINKSIAENLNQYPEVRKYLKHLGSLQAVNKELQAKTLKDNEEKINESVKFNLDLMRSMYSEGYIIKRYGSVDKFEKKIIDKVITRYKNAVVHKATGEYANFTYNLVNPNSDNIGIRFNEKFGTKAGIEEALTRSSQVGFHPEKCDTLKSVVDHEFGHAIDFYIKTKNGHINTKPYKELQDFYKSLSYADIKDGLSKYGAENFKEFIAEGYSEYRNNPKPREIAQKIGTLLTQAYKEVTENGGNN